jgi:Secretion system C-terminal sorting domain
MKQFICLFLLLLSLVFKINAQVKGCTDAAANNYNTSATENDGSCTYNNVTLSPQLVFNLNTALNETSGLVYWKKLIWSHNDSGNGPVIYGLQNTSGTIQRTVSVSNATNIDWEDIAQDNSYIYIGDFGNNSNGNRTDLRIYRIAKSAVTAGDNVTAAVINFSYSDQTDFTPKGANNTNYDCEAIIAYGDSLFLFSKNWVDNKTRLYKLPKTPGTYTATKLDELNVSGLITGAEILPDQRVIVLSGYNTLLSPFIYLLYDFNGNNFFGANKRKVSVNASFTQMEGICAKSTTKFLVSNERYNQFPVTTPAKVNQLNLASLLNPYYQSGLSVLKKEEPVYNKPASGNSFVNVQYKGNNLYIKKNMELAKDATVEIYDLNGLLKLNKRFSGSETVVDISLLDKGLYVANIFNSNQQLSTKFFKE